MQYFKGDRKGEAVIIYLEDNLVVVYSNGRTYKKFFNSKISFSKFCFERFKVVITEEINEATYVTYFKEVNALTKDRVNIWTRDRLVQLIAFEMKCAYHSDNLEAQIAEAIIEIENITADIAIVAVYEAAKSIVEKIKAIKIAKDIAEEDKINKEKTLKNRVALTQKIIKKIDVIQMSNLEFYCSKLLNSLQETSKLSKVTYSRVMNFTKQNILNLSDIAKQDRVLDSTSLLISEAKVCFFLDEIIACSSKHVKSSLVLSTANFILNELQRIDVCAKGPTRQKINEYIDNHLRSTLHKNTLMFNTQGIRQRTEWDTFIDFDYNTHNDGSFGENNYSENGRYVSGASFDRMDDESFC